MRKVSKTDVQKIDSEKDYALQTFEYVRDHNRNLIGVVVGVSHHDHVQVGMSFCHEKDKFNKKYGVEFATKRAYSSNQLIDLSIVPQYVKDNYLPNLVKVISNVVRMATKRYFLPYVPVEKKTEKSSIDPFSFSISLPKHTSELFKSIMV